MCKLNMCDGCENYSFPSKDDNFKPHCMSGHDVNNSDECTSYKKEFVGTVCGHHEQIIADGDAYMVEFKDVCGDVCEQCFIDYGNIRNACDMTPETESPYAGNLTDYWYDGTLEEFKSEIEGADEVAEDIVECLFSDVDEYAENMKGLIYKGLIANPKLKEEYKEWFKL